MRPAPGLTIEQQPQGVIVRMCLWAEARGESPVGRAAVLWVIRNRAARSGATIKDVVLHHSDKGTYAFTSFDPRDPNQAKLLIADREDADSWARCDELVTLAEAQLIADPTRGATHYYNPDVCKPAWGRGDEHWHETAVIGKHVFGIAP